MGRRKGGKNGEKTPDGSPRQQHTCKFCHKPMKGHVGTEACPITISHQKNKSRPVKFKHKTRDDYETQPDSAQPSVIQRHCWNDVGAPLARNGASPGLELTTPTSSTNQGVVIPSPDPLPYSTTVASNFLRIPQSQKSWDDICNASYDPDAVPELYKLFDFCQHPC